MTAKEVACHGDGSRDKSRDGVVGLRQGHGERATGQREGSGFGNGVGPLVALVGREPTGRVKSSRGPGAMGQWRGVGLLKEMAAVDR